MLTEDGAIVLLCLYVIRHAVNSEYEYLKLNWHLNSVSHELMVMVVHDRGKSGHPQAHILP